MTRSSLSTGMRRYPLIGFFSDIATRGKGGWPIRFNATDPKMPVVNDPIRGASRKVIDMTILESYGGGGTSLDNPRGQLQAPASLFPGARAWISFSLLLPADRPLPTAPYPSGWQAFFQIWGPSTTGYPSFRIAYEGNAGEFGWRRQPTKGGEWACQIVPQTDAWMDFAIAVHMHPDPALGWIEVWTNFGTGWIQRDMTAAPGDILVGKRLYTETITPGYSASSLYASHVQNYRKTGMYDSATCHHADHRQVESADYDAEAASLVAGTFTALDPKSHA